MLANIAKCAFRPGSRLENAALQREGFVSDWKPMPVVPPSGGPSDSKENSR